MTNLYDMNQATASDMSNAVKDVTIPAMNTDGPTGSGETSWQNSNWSTQYGHFLKIPELHSAFIMKSVWTCGKGYECDNETKIILGHWKGFGKDTARDLLFNSDLVKNIGGDSFAEIVWNDKEQRLFPLNLKPLDPSTIKIISDEKGILDRYEQTTKSGKIIKFDPRDIFHLSNCRAADSIHGISKQEAMTDTIKAINEAFVDTKKIAHHQARPWILWRLKTDDPTTISQIKTKIDNARNLGEDTFIPDDDDAVSHEVVQVTPSNFILEWINNLNNRFYRALGLPLVLFGQAGTTESGGKIEYLGHETQFENDQKYIEEQVWNQLHLKINLIPPTSLLDSLQQDQSKDAAQGMEMQQSDMTAGAGR